MPDVLRAGGLVSLLGGCACRETVPAFFVGAGDGLGFDPLR
ncbi:MAG TPA: hypothetical protein VEZ40_04025 [Pyrinomonadaceae bacterium]|nr:hypothetical protein [Pyrinomonadaceae bacterium]